MTLKIEKCSGT